MLLVTNFLTVVRVLLRTLFSFGNTAILQSHLFTGLTPVYVYRVGELEEQLDNKEKEHRETKLKSDERIRMLEKKYVFLISKNKIEISAHFMAGN